jgi:hypothetical protein
MVHRDGAPTVVLRIRALPDEGIDQSISEPGQSAFLPSAIVDEDGRMHVVYYDSGGAVGVLRYTRSVSADWSEGFEPSTVIDTDACPGNDWFPFFDTAAGGRRLREYIDVAISGRRLHVAWTHSPTPPSRVWVTYVDF